MSAGKPPLPDPLQVKAGKATHLFLWICIALVGGFAVWAAVGQLDIVSHAMGKVVPASKVQSVQHLEGGIVREILVAEGMRVAKDQPLVELEPTTSGADVAQLEVRLDGLRITEARLMAEAEVQEKVVFAPDLVKRRPELVEQARRLFDTRRERLEIQLTQQREAVSQREYEIREVQARLNANRRSLGLINEQLEISRKLLKLDLANRMEHLGLEREANTLKGRIQEDGELLPRNEAGLAEARAHLAALRSAFIEDARHQLQENQVNLKELEQRSLKLEDSLKRTVLRSPTDGIIKTLHVTTVGGVVRPGGLVVDVVPSDDRLVIEAQLPNRDIGYVRPGQTALIQLASAEAARFGRLEGRVLHVAPDALVTEQGVPYYLVRIETEKAYFEKRGLRYDLFPGVQVQCSIQTGQRSVFEYLFEPYLGSVDQALKER